MDQMKQEQCRKQLGTAETRTSSMSTHFAGEADEARHPAPQKKLSITQDFLSHEVQEVFTVGDSDTSSVIVRTDSADGSVRVYLLKNKSERTISHTPDDSLNPLQTCSMEQIQNLLHLSEQQMKDIREAAKNFPMKIPEYYARLMMEHPVLQKVVLPSPWELVTYDDDQGMDVHTDESRYQPVEGIVHRYPGKVLFFPTLQCLGHCRFCFRTGNRVKPLNRNKVEVALEYIRNRPDIREVILTGGDPLTLSVNELDEILGNIRSIPHIEIIRVGTRALSYAPQLITAEMVSMLAGHNPVFLCLSFVHPAEITAYCEEKLAMLADAGIVMLQQGPLLKGVNDTSETLIAMYEKLARNRVLAYYAIYGIYAPGVRHFLVEREQARNIFLQMENRTSGYCLPHLSTLDQNDNKTRSVL